MRFRFLLFRSLNSIETKIFFKYTRIIYYIIILKNIYIGRNNPTFMAFYLMRMELTQSGSLKLMGIRLRKCGSARTEKRNIGST